MTRIQCPQESCIHWVDGLCGSIEIELEAHTLICLTFEEPVDAVNVAAGVHVNDALSDEDVDIDWDDDDSLIEDELDERLYENKVLDLRSNLDDDDEYDDFEDDDFDDFDEADDDADDGLGEDEFFKLARERNNW